MINRFVPSAAAAAPIRSAKRRSTVRFAVAMAVALTTILATSIAAHAVACGDRYFGVCPSDGNACTIETCVYVQTQLRGHYECYHGWRYHLRCDDLDPCTTDTCDPAVGCVHTGVTCATTTTTDGSATTTTNSSVTTTTLVCSGTCGDPVTHAGAPTSVTASDALYVLDAAVGTQTCDPCICDVDNSGGITASDALLTLAASVGSATLRCP